MKPAFKGTWTKIERKQKPGSLQDQQKEISLKPPKYHLSSYPLINWEGNRSQHMGVSKNSGTPNHPCLGFSIMHFHHPFWGTPPLIFGKHPYSFSTTLDRSPKNQVINPFQLTTPTGRPPPLQGHLWLLPVRRSRHQSGEDGTTGGAPGLVI